MKRSFASTLVFLLLLGANPSWADPDVFGQRSHDVDMYGIYKIYDLPPMSHQMERRREDPPQAPVTTVYVPVAVPIIAPAPEPPVTALTLTPPQNPETGTASEDEVLLRDPSAVETRLHQLYLTLNNKLSNGKIASDLFDEENRYLGGLEQQIQADITSNGGALTVAQENVLLQNFQDVENEINQGS